MIWQKYEINMKKKMNTNKISNWYDKSIKLIKTKYKCQLKYKFNEIMNQSVGSQYIHFKDKILSHFSHINHDEVSKNPS